MEEIKYQAGIDLSNENNSHTVAFRRVQEIAFGRKLAILEVGCSTGYFGKALIDHGHTVLGVEPNHKAAEIARQVLKDVFVGYVQDYFNENPDAFFDIIIFGDVLEHIANPSDILIRCKQFIKPNGALIASVPNVAHFAIRAMLLDGRWDYGELGILDKTHLRFLTRDSIIDLFSKASYNVLSVDSVRLSAETVDELCQLNLSKQSIDCVTSYARDNRGYDFQYILVGKPCDSHKACIEHNQRIKDEEGLRVLCLVHDPNSSIVDIRLRNPLTGWANRCGAIVRILSIFEHNHADLVWADVFVFQRESNEYIEGLSKYIRSSGKRFVFEIDDLLTDIPDFLSHHAVALEAMKPFMLSTIQRADAVSVSTKQLRDQLQPLNDHIFITPNYSEPTYTSANHIDVASCEVNLIIASSDDILVDMILTPVKEMQQKYGVVVIGIGPPGKRLAEAGITVLQYENMPHSKFKAFLVSLDNSIAVIPLDDSRFSACKSAIKYFDYALAGIPAICSDTIPYRTHIDAGITGYLASSSHESWVSHLEILILDHQMRKRIALQAREYVIQHCSLEESVSAWSRLFNSLHLETPERRSHPDARSMKYKTEIWNIRRLLAHVKKPSSYIKAVSIIHRHGLIGFYNKLRRG